MTTKHGPKAHGAWIPDDIWVGTPFDHSDPAYVQAAQAAEEDMWAAAVPQAVAEAPTAWGTRSNRYQGACARCSLAVPARTGALYKTPAGRWAVAHHVCPNAA